MWDFLSLYMSVFSSPTHFLSSSLCLTWLQKSIWFLFATEGLDCFNARKRKAALNCDEISMSSKYEPLGHDLLVIANVFVCICSDSEGYLKTPASLLSELLCMILHVRARERKRDVFLHRHKLKNLVTEKPCHCFSLYLYIQCIYFHQREIFVLIQFSKNKCNMHICNAYSLKQYCPQRK